MKNTKQIYILSITMMLILLVACSPAQKPLPNQPNNLQPNQNQDQLGILPNQPQNIGGQKLSTNDNLNFDIDNNDNMISKEILSLGNIKRAPVVISGDKALVGVDMIDGTQSGIKKIKDTILNNRYLSNANNSNLLNNTRIPMAPYTQQRNTQNNYYNQNQSIDSLITQLVKRMSPNTKNVLVTTDDELITRLENVNKNMSSEITDIYNKIRY